MTVQRLHACDLILQRRPWCFASRYAREIEEYWNLALARNSKLFNGDVFVLHRWSVADGILSGAALSAKFSAYLYWRNGGVAQAPYEEAFATTVLISRDGGVLLARSVSGTLNEGRYCSPGGLFDRRDVEGSRRIDAAGAAARELQEEVGLLPLELDRQPGFLLAHVPPYLAVASVFRSALTGDELLGRVGGFLAGETEPELEAPRVVYGRSDLDRLTLTPFADLLTAHVLGM